MMKKCLLVIDYQHDFIDGALGFPKAKTLAPGIKALMNQFHQEHHDVIITYDTHDETYMKTVEGKYLPIPHCIKNTKGHMLYEDIRDALSDQDKIYEKPTFGSLELANDLKNKQYDEIHIVGLVTNICVVSNAILAKAALPNSEIIIHQNLCASFDEQGHEAALYVMKSCHMRIED
jgi:nicotinamidase-related amidase